MDEGGLFQVYWSRFENWDDELHLKTAREHCGLRGSDNPNPGTFTTHSQTDDIMQPFFMFMAFVKFGFGRATADVNLAIRNGRMTREQGTRIVLLNDGAFPTEYTHEYQQYFDMTGKEFYKKI